VSGALKLRLSRFPPSSTWFCSRYSRAAKPSSGDAEDAVGASMITIDTLVHNFLHRTGILHRLDAEHTYGMACYRPGGCASVIEALPGSALEVIETEFFFQLLGSLLANPSRLDGGRQGAKVILRR
jgi:hypothetical protein